MQQTTVHNTPAIQPSQEDIQEIADKLITKLIDSGDPLVDTLALMLNKEAREAIEEGRKESREGKEVPITSILD